MNKIEFNKILDKWNPTIEEFIKIDNTNNDDINQDSLSKVEKMSLYAHYHSELESDHGTIYEIPNVEKRKSLLDFSLKVLNRLSNLDNIYFINSPKYDINNFTYIVGSVALSFDVNENENDIINKIVEHFEKIKTDKKVYIYIVAQSLSIITEQNFKGRITVESRYFTI
jgi:hypothetical protein